jgi:hypothetical protein
MEGKVTGRRGGIRSWLVDPYRQVKLGLVFLFLNVVFSILILSVFGYYVMDMYDAMAALFKLSSEDASLILQKFQVPIIVGGILILVFVATTITVSIRFTHQIYGPLVSMYRFLDELLAGHKPSKIQLRSSDQLQELAARLNSVAERLVDDTRGGPLVPIHRFLDDLALGKKPEKIKLRDGDLYGDLAAKLNRLADKA